jgi:hypothetical protein
MYPHRRPTTLPSLIALAATLVAASLGLAACGSSSSTTTTTTTQTTANAAATGATTGTTTTGATTTGTSTSRSGKSASGGASSGTSTTGTSSTGATTTPGGSTTGTTPASSRTARIAAVHTCLTKKGITLGSGGLAGAHLPKGMTREQFLAAFESCGRGLVGNDVGKGRFKQGFDSARYRAVLARFAACLRQNGIKIGEPNTSGKGPTFDTKGINTGSPQFKAAVASCRSTLRGAYARPGSSKAS